MPDDQNQPPPPPETPLAQPAAQPPPVQPVTPQQQPPSGYQPPRPAYPYTPQFGGYAGPYAGAYGAAAMYPPRKPRSAWFWPVIILSCILVFGLLLWAVVYSVMHSSDEATSGPAFSSSRIAVIDVSGVIVDADKIDAQLRKFGDDDSVKAIILHIDSPGGGAAVSQEIYHEVRRVREDKKKPIIASVESVGASGAYYIASGCDKIYANEASVVGSIGVIMEWTNYGDLYKWAKLKSVVIHAGELKDAGDPTHDMTPQEAVYFQSLVDNMYAQFIHDVADGRKQNPADIRKLATGQVWTGQQSLQMHLIDKLGGFRVALIDTARQVGIKDEPTIVRPSTPKKGLSAFLDGDSDDLFFPSPTKLLDKSPGFYFMWK
jgi:protease-4